MSKLISALHRVAAIDINSGEIDVPKSTLDAQSILSLVFAFAGAIAVIVIAIAGLQYVISRGDPAATAKAKNAIIYAFIGLLVCIFAYSIVTFVVTRI